MYQKIKDEIKLILYNKRNIINAINDLLRNKSIDIYDDDKYRSSGDWSLSSLIKTFQRHRYESNIK